MTAPRSGLTLSILLGSGHSDLEEKSSFIRRPRSDLAALKGICFVGSALCGLLYHRQSCERKAPSWAKSSAARLFGA
jgi:hypothetical protein